MAQEAAAKLDIVIRGVKRTHLSALPDRRTVVSPEAFTLRMNRDGVPEEYLSVDFEELSTPAESLARWGYFKAVYRLPVDGIHATPHDLSVHPVPVEGNPAHAGIFGIPPCRIIQMKCTVVPSLSQTTCWR